MAVALRTDEFELDRRELDLRRHISPAGVNHQHGRVEVGHRITGGQGQRRGRLGEAKGTEPLLRGLMYGYMLIPIRQRDYTSHRTRSGHGWQDDRLETCGRSLRAAYCSRDSWE